MQELSLLWDWNLIFDLSPKQNNLLHTCSLISKLPSIITNMNPTRKKFPSGSLLPWLGVPLSQLGVPPSQTRGPSFPGSGSLLPWLGVPPSRAMGPSFPGSGSLLPSSGSLLPRLGVPTSQLGVPPSRARGSSFPGSGSLLPRGHLSNISNTFTTKTV